MGSNLLIRLRMGSSLSRDTVVDLAGLYEGVWFRSVRPSHQGAIIIYVNRA